MADKAPKGIWNSYKKEGDKVVKKNKSCPKCGTGFSLAAHKDRLLRFGAELVFAICEAKDVEVLIINKGVDTTFEEDLAKDVLEIITVFSARLYGSRSRKNQKLLDGVKQAVEAAAC